MTRLFGLLIVAVLCVWALYGAGAISWVPTPWETHAAQTVTKDAGNAATSIGVKVNVPPKPPWETPAPATTPATPKTTTPSTPAQSVTTVYPVGNGQTVAAPQATPSITAAYCSLENVPAGEDGCP